jgi:ketosteroid isomerase-like protein
MKKNIFFTLLTTVLMISGTMMHQDAKAQEWSSAQKEVLKVVNDYWAVMAKGDIAGFYEYFSPDYLGWDDGSPLPSTRAEAQKWLQYFTQGQKISFYEVKPVGIRVFGDFGYVHYYYTMVIEKDGKKKVESGRWTDILMKQGGKWLCVGDHGGEPPRKQED